MLVFEEHLQRHHLGAVRFGLDHYRPVCVGTCYIGFHVRDR
jgi:hypothetical protein